MNLDDFDAQPGEDIMTASDLQAAQTDLMRRYRTARDLILTPEVAVALRDGWRLQEIADVLGVSYQTVLKHVKSADMQDLIDRESRRVMRHLASRKLGSEKYRDLALSLGVLIDKARLLRNEPTEIVQHEEGTAARLAELFFRRRQRPVGEDTGTSAIELTPDRDGSGVLGLPERSAETVSGPGGCDPASGDESSESG